MAKEAKKFLKVDPWIIQEESFDQDRALAAESIFSLANEYVGLRGYFEEGYSGESLIGIYFNGIYAEKPIHYPERFNGFAENFQFMINSADWLYTRIRCNGRQLDLHSAEITDYTRTLDFKTGLLSRSFIWVVDNNKIKIEFKRILSMDIQELASQHISFTLLNPMKDSILLEVVSGIDFSILHQQRNANFWDVEQIWLEPESNNIHGILCSTKSTTQKILSSYQIKATLDDQILKDPFNHKSEKKLVQSKIQLDFKKGSSLILEKKVVNNVDRKGTISNTDMWYQNNSIQTDIYDFEKILQTNTNYWEKIWKNLDIEIQGDSESQQGVRYCLFQLHQTYRGKDSDLNIGAKGLTGEQYYGWIWWDTETYCLPFYLLTDPQAAKQLLRFRFNSLPQAIERAKVLDCKGACYPMGTINGTESCHVWQHGNLEIHVTAAVWYGIWHYYRVTNDFSIYEEFGAEILIQISRYFASRGDWSPKTGEFGYYGVMGADEFHMMVHNNAYTNIMAKKAMENTVEVLTELKNNNKHCYNELCTRTNLSDSEIDDWKNKAEKTRTNYNSENGLFEQHDGYFDLPEVDVKALPPESFPIYKHWSYDHIFRVNMIKQPDVLLLMFFFSGEYDLSVKKNNYDFYEPRCSHESSLSPAIHSILAAELGLHQQAIDFSRFASRLDLDDYNRNTHEGLHITSMFSVWMNIIYGYGGIRTDGDTLVCNPYCPDSWEGYNFNFTYKERILRFEVNKKELKISKLEGDDLEIVLFGNMEKLTHQQLIAAVRELNTIHKLGYGY